MTDKPIEERFESALSELIGMCIEAGMHTADMIGPLKRELAWCRHASLPSKADEEINTKGGLPPLTKEDICKMLELEPYEPIPKPS